MPRTVNPATAYRFVAHSTHGHVYASVQCAVVGKDGRNVRRHRHYGVLDGKKFTPWAEFLALPGEERAKFVFPPDWDLSLLDRLSDRRGQGRPVLDGEAQNRLYGDVWLLEQIAERTKIRRDLEAVFDGDKEMVDAIMALAMFPYLTGFSFSRVERWQRNVKSPCDFPLSPKTITKLTQAITEKYFEQMKDQMAADRQRCWSEEGWTGRQLILFVSLILGSQVRHVWRTKLKDKFSSSLEILDEIRCIRCMEHPGHAGKITPFVGAQLEICEAFGFEPTKGCDKIYTSIRKQERKRGRPRKKVVEVNND